MPGRSKYASAVWLAVLAALLTALTPDLLSATRKKRGAAAADAAPAQDATTPAVVPMPEPPPTVTKRARPLRTEGPNVLFILVDDLNDWVGWMRGHPQARTPNMDRLARAGVRFSNAHCAWSGGNASRTALLTGLWPWQTGVISDEIDWRRAVPLREHATLPAYFRESGFLTAAGGKVFHANPGGPESRQEGWDGGRRGFEQDAAWDVRFPGGGVQMPVPTVRPGQNFNGLGLWRWDWGGIDAKPEETDDGQVAAWAEKFLQQKYDGPFFLTVGLSRPHAPWYVPRSYLTDLPVTDIMLPEVKANDLDDVPDAAKGYLKTSNDHQRLVEKNLWPSAVRGYLASIAFCDAMVGRVLDALERSPHKGNTIIVLASDQGRQLGEKQRWHEGGLWEQATHVPLVIVAPGMTQPEGECLQPVSLVDLYPTLCELAGLKPPAGLAGESLVPLLKAPATARKAGPALTGAMPEEGKAGFAARSDRWRYIRYGDGSEELYDHQTDPHEWTNLLRGAPPAAEAQQAMAALKKALPKPGSLASASRELQEVAVEGGSDGSLSYWFQAGDAFPPAESPAIAQRPLEIEAILDYNPEVDRDSTVVSQGTARLGYALHFVDGRLAFTVNYEGLRATLKSPEPLPAGRVTLRALLGLDGSLAFSATGLKDEVRGYAPMEGGFPRHPEVGLSVGTGSGPLPPAQFPNSSPFDGVIHHLRLTLLPGAFLETRIPKAVPVE